MPPFDPPKRNGRPPDYKPECCERILPLGPLGCKVGQMADFFGVTERTIYNWLETYEEFGLAVRLCRLQAHFALNQSLFKQATTQGHTGAAQFLLSRLWPDDYKEKTDVHLSGNVSLVLDQEKFSRIPPEQQEGIRRRAQASNDELRPFMIEAPKKP